MSPDFLLALRGVFLQSFASEHPVTKKVIAAIPDENHDYRPDPKAKTAIELGWHIASVDIWFLDSIAALSFAMGGAEKPADLQSGVSIAAWYEKALPAAIAKVEAMSAEQLGTPVDFFGMFNFPAVFYLQFLMNHSIHHRGQLSTYLRPMGSKCPSIYGGSADEPMGM